MFELIYDRKWSAALLTDLRFPESGCCDIQVHGSNWLLVHEGRVGVALSPFLAARWRAGGSITVRSQGWYDGIRAFGLALPAEGWRPGFLLVPVYAPLVRNTTLEQRDSFREQLSNILDHSSSRRRLIVGGDFNGEVGATKDGEWKHIMGPFGDSRRTKGGEELLQFCEQEQLAIANTYTRQKHKATWFHSRWGTAHALDHFLVRTFDRRWVATVTAIHFASSQQHTCRSKFGRPSEFSSAPWLQCTDHDPVELSFRTGKD